MIITIDGPAGTGKTTVARKVAEKLRIPYFDTGAMYRAVAWSLLQNGVKLQDRDSLEKLLEKFSFEIKIEDHKTRYLVSGVDVTDEIRSQEVTRFVSEVSANELVRNALWKVQKKFGAKGSGVFEGRDMGTVVFPEAKLKVYLTARPEVRAERRLEELKRKQPKEAEQLTRQQMLEQINARDTYDSSRELAPLKKAKDAYLIDTSDLSIDEVIDKILAIHKKIIKKMQIPWLYCKEMHFFYRFILFLAWCLYRLCYRTKVYGLEHYTPGAAIIAPNHTSYLDPPIVAISWPEEVHFLARESLFKPFLFGPFIRALNSHPVSGNSSDVSVFKTIIKLLNEKKKLILFPEGERSISGELKEIKPGIALLISKTENAAIIPTYLDGLYEIWKRGQKLPKLRGKTACVFGSPLFWDSYAHLDRKEAQIALSKQISESILKLKDWYEKGAQGTPP